MMLSWPLPVSQVKKTHRNINNQLQWTFNMWLSNFFIPLTVCGIRIFNINLRKHPEPGGFKTLEMESSITSCITTTREFVLNKQPTPLTFWFTIVLYKLQTTFPSTYQYTIWLEMLPLEACSTEAGSKTCNAACGYLYHSSSSITTGQTENHSFFFWMTVEKCGNNRQKENMLQV
jgi:hypothetical protein